MWQYIDKTSKGGKRLLRWRHLFVSFHASKLFFPTKYVFLKQIKRKNSLLITFIVEFTLISLFMFLFLVSQNGLWFLAAHTLHLSKLHRPRWLWDNTSMARKKSTAKTIYRLLLDTYWINLLLLFSRREDQRKSETELFPLSKLFITLRASKTASYTDWLQLRSLSHLMIRCKQGVIEFTW